jgi:hypothetical protein
MYFVSFEIEIHFCFSLFTFIFYYFLNICMYHYCIVLFQYNVYCFTLFFENTCFSLLGIKTFFAHF